MTRRTFAAIGAGAAMFEGRVGAASPNPDIVRAMESVRAAIPKAEADPERPVYHFRPPANWNNDPNGTIYYRGWHHLFYQHNPYGSGWGHMHWGHARSRDLVNWEHLPIALAPSLDKGEDGIFSGCAWPGPDGRPRIIYTSVSPKREPEQWLATAVDDDLIHWEKFAGNPILAQKAHRNGPVPDWRDPFLFTARSATYMVCGGNRSNRREPGTSEVQLYRAEDARLTAWQHLGPVFRNTDQETANIECPNLFPLGGKWVMIVSPEKPCQYWVGDLDLDRVRFTPEVHGVLDPGDSYASNISVDDKGRTLLWLWARTDTGLAKGWNSCMTIPRVLSLGPGNRLIQTPAPEFVTLRGEVREAGPIEIKAGQSMPLGSIRGDCLEIEAEFTRKGGGEVGLLLRSSGPGRGFPVKWHSGDGFLEAGGARKLTGNAQPLKLHIFLDKRLVEVYANGGQAITRIVKEPLDAKDIMVFANGDDATLVKFRAWTMKPAQFSLEHFV